MVPSLRRLAKGQGARGTLACRIAGGLSVACMDNVYSGLRHHSIVTSMPFRHVLRRVYGLNVHPEQTPNGIFYLSNLCVALTVP